MLRIAIADDHAMFVDGIESILRDEKTIKVVDKCFDGKSVFGMLQKQPIDVLLLDINLPDMSGIEVAKKLNVEFPDVKIIAVSMYNEESIVSEMLNNGAQGYILKNTGRAEPVSYTHLRAHETVLDLVCGLLLEKKQNKKTKTNKLLLS